MNFTFQLNIKDNSTTPSTTVHKLVATIEGKEYSCELTDPYYTRASDERIQWMLLQSLFSKLAKDVYSKLHNLANSQNTA